MDKSPDIDIVSPPPAPLSASPGDGGLDTGSSQPRKWIGLLALAAGLGVAEIVTGFDRFLRSPVIAVGDWIIDHTPGWLERFAIRTFGTNDKLVLKWGIFAVLIVLSLRLAGVMARRRNLARGLVVVVSIVGATLAFAGRAGRLIDVLPALVGGAVTLVVLEKLVPRRVTSPASPESGGAATSAVAAASGVERRQFIMLASGAGVVAVGGFGVGRALRTRYSAALDRAKAILPKSKTLPAAPEGVDFNLPGLSPIFTPNKNFYLIDASQGAPNVTRATWALRVRGMVDKEINLNFDQLLARPQFEVDVTISCVSNEVGGDLVGTARWQGIRLDDLLHEAGIKPEADQIVGRSIDGWTGGFPTAVLDGRDAMIAIGMNGEPLPVSHGYPARLIVPGVYGYVSATKWLSEIELTRFDKFQGFWIPRGWNVDGVIETESRIDVPGSSIAAGPTKIAGVAWAGIRTISKVEVQINKDPWREGTLSKELAKTTWRQWVLDWDAPKGKHDITVRATDGDGKVQTDKQTSPGPGAASGYHTIRVTVG